MKFVVAKVGPHVLVFQLSSFAPVLPASPAGQGDQVEDKPDGDTCTKGGKWVLCAKSAG